LDGIAVLETESGFEVEMDLDSLPPNIKVGQTIKCAMTLNPTTNHREMYIPTEDEYRKKLPNGKVLID
jgi:hypothetical protein